MGSAGVTRLRVATYNVHRATGTDGRRDPVRIAAVIRELGADIVGLQEVDWHQEKGEAILQSQYLAEMPGFHAIAGSNLLDHRGHYGNLLLTRLDSARVERIDISQPGRERRGAIDVDLRLAEGHLRVIVTHFGLTPGERLRQAVRLHKAICRRGRNPTVMLGDFNEWLPNSPTLRPLYRLCGRRPAPKSYPSWYPVFALDRILACTGALRLDVRQHCSPLARKASDHLPIVADVEFDDRLGRNVR